jgi:uncharacterized membrane protein YhaH (DUF805 family)
LGSLGRFFSFKGRANRLRYWLTSFGLAALFLLGIILVGALAALTPMLGLIAIPLAVAFFWASLAVGARRLHDRDKSAWWVALLQAVPFVLSSLSQLLSKASSEDVAALAAALGLISLPFSIWAFVELGCLRGTVGPNRFGADPLGSPAAEVFA